MAGDKSFLSRWSRRKIEAEAKDEGAPGIESTPPERAPQPPAPSRPAEAKPLPPVASLTPDSDFTPFLGREVDEGLKRAALKTLFADPRFNAMDGLDVYIDDYSKPDPLPDSWRDQLRQLANLGHGQEAPPAELEPRASAPESDKQKIALEQGLVDGTSTGSSDTADAGSARPEVKQSGV